MRGASRTSLGAVTEDLRPVLEGARGTTLGEQLFGVVDVLDGSGPLRRALTDPARDAEALALSRAVRWHGQRRVLRNGSSTVVFR